MATFIEILSVALVFMFAAYAGIESASKQLLANSEPVYDLADQVEIKIKKNERVTLRFPLVLTLAHALVMIGLTPWITGFLVTITVNLVAIGMSFLLTVLQLDIGAIKLPTNFSEEITIWKWGIMVLPGFYIGRASVFGFAARQALVYLNRLDSSKGFSQYINRLDSNWHYEGDATYKKIFLEQVNSQKL
jgi:hypothetical protein